jgi:hypothetical protein
MSVEQKKSLLRLSLQNLGHLLSDVNAKSPTGMKLSVPAPLTPLLQMIQVGSVTYMVKRTRLAI